MNTRNWDDNYIASQLEQLHGLPEGYAPNIHSKWELLEASLDQQRPSKKGVFWGWRLAASVVLIVALALLIRQPMAPTLETRTTATGLPVPTVPPTPVSQQTQPAAPVKRNIITTIPVRSFTSSEMTEVVTIPPEEVVANTPTPASGEEVPLANKKKMKARFMQMDFGETETFSTPPPVLANGVHIQLGSTLSSTTVEVNEAQPNKSLRIRF
jgi:hypothetical protein